MASASFSSVSAAATRLKAPASEPKICANACLLAKSSKAEKALAEANEALATEKDKFLRLFAEFENYKKRTSKERIELFKTAGQEVISSMLPILDDFNRALKESEKQENSADFEGFRLISNKLNEYEAISKLLKHPQELLSAVELLLSNNQSLQKKLDSFNLVRLKEVKKQLLSNRKELDSFSIIERIFNSVFLSAIVTGLSSLLLSTLRAVSYTHLTLPTILLV